MIQASPAEISISQMLKMNRCYVPKSRAASRARCRSRLLPTASGCNAASARQYGAEIRTYHQVKKLLHAGTKWLALSATIWSKRRRRYHLRRHGGQRDQRAWVGKIAHSVGTWKVRVIASKGHYGSHCHACAKHRGQSLQNARRWRHYRPCTGVAIISTTDVRAADRNILPLSRGSAAYAGRGRKAGARW